MSGTLPSYEVLVFIHVIKNDEAVFGNEMTSVVKREAEYYGVPGGSKVNFTVQCKLFYVQRKIIFVRRKLFYVQRHSKYYF